MGDGHQARPAAGLPSSGGEPLECGRYSHDLLVHDTDEELLDTTRAFVERGLASGGRVLVHSSAERVALLRGALGSHPRLDYGLDSDLYESPAKTLFAYERSLAAEPNELWVAGTVPLGDDPAGHAAWLRYESLVNEVLGHHAFHALCTYDARTLPASTIAAARAAHPGVSSGGDRSRRSADYLAPADFLADPLARVPVPPASAPALMETLDGLPDVRRVRRLVAAVAESTSALPRDVVDAFVVAVHEVLVNGLRHGAPPVEVTLWVETTRLTCRVTDLGPGMADTLSGYRRPVGAGSTGLWVARQLCEELVVTNPPGGGCSVLLTAG
jgi:anti-sigma regulatory factor (Ser/Thr protein kinase)